MPILPSFFASHQWLRELRRLGSTPLVAVDFVVPDAEEVHAGHYSRPHATMIAAEAIGVILHAEDPPRLRGCCPTQDPGSCEVCQRGTYKAAQSRQS